MCGNIGWKYQLWKYWLRIHLDTNVLCVWSHSSGGVISKLGKRLPVTFCWLIESYLAVRNFGVVFEEAKSIFHYISTGIHVGSVLGSFLYLRYTNDPPANNNTITATFSVHIVILSGNDSEAQIVENLQIPLNPVKCGRKTEINLDDAFVLCIHYVKQTKIFVFI